MRFFSCGCTRASALYFNNSVCTACGREVGFCSDALDMHSFDRSADGAPWTSRATGAAYRPCANRSTAAGCNWMVPDEDPEQFCVACRLNEIIPDLSIAENQSYWAKLELAKRRALYSLLALRLPVNAKEDPDAPQLRFRFLADKRPDSEFTEPLPEMEPVMTGHEAGVITINLQEADDVARTRARLALGERYRTLLGHFRHELGHYYWDLLIRPDAERLNAFRAMFGDERQDYETARQAHYSRGSEAGIQEQFVSHYAAMHPWEDWAETWAHYLHLVDTLETAHRLNLGIAGQELGGGAVPEPEAPPAQFSELLDQWLKLSTALNALNRSMGIQDAYPFVLHAPVQKKLSWVHDLVIESRVRPAGQAR